MEQGEFYEFIGEQMGLEVQWKLDQLLNFYGQGRTFRGKGFIRDLSTMSYDDDPEVVKHRASEILEDIENFYRDLLELYGLLRQKQASEI